MFYIAFFIFAYTIFMGGFTLLTNKAKLNFKSIAKFNNFLWRSVLNPSFFLRFFIETNFELIIDSYLQLMVA